MTLNIKSTARGNAIDSKIYKPAQACSRQVGRYLAFLRSKGLDNVPELLEFDRFGNEVLSYVDGETCDYPLSEAVKSEHTLISVAKLLRRYHDISEQYVKAEAFPLNGWMFPARHPIQVICHNDFAPYNICFNEIEAIGLIDFETAAPGPRVWDLAYALYRFAPFTHPCNKDGFGTLADQARRAKIFCDIYGLNDSDRDHITNVMIERLEALNEFLLYAANKGDLKYQACVSAGHHKLYKADIKYIKNNKRKIQDELLR